MSWTRDSFQVPPKEGSIRFHDLDLSDPVLHAIQDLTFQYCSPIQAEVLPYTLAGLDVIGQAQTGTGKTAAFLISVIEKLLKRDSSEPRYHGEPHALVLAPTRELALQIEKDAKGLTKYTSLTSLTLVGGMDYEKQRRALNQGVIDILVATPGRLIDFLRNREVNLQEVEVLVLDEADRMLDMGFIPDVRKIVRQTPRKEYRQTLLFSATFNDEVMYLSDQWTLEPEKISIVPENVATDTVDQRVYLVTSEQKYPLLKKLIRSEHLDKLMVFANRRDETRKLFEELKADGISCAMLSGEVPQNKRIKTLEQFKNGQINVLIATDVSGRGIHIDDVSHVVNFSLPEDPEDYVHRIGRTGRAGKSGISISFACEDDSFLIPTIEKYIGAPLKCIHPNPDEVL